MTLFGYTRMRALQAPGRAFLYVAAAFNLAAAPLVVALARTAPGVLVPQPLGPGAWLFVDLAALLIAGFGAGYALAARDLPRFWPYVSLGAACKAGVAILASACFFSGRAGPLVMLLASGDAIFAVLFVGLLRRHGTV